MYRSKRTTLAYQFSALKAYRVPGLLNLLFPFSCRPNFEYLSYYISNEYLLISFRRLLLHLRDLMIHTISVRVSLSVVHILVRVTLITVLTKIPVRFY